MQKKEPTLYSVGSCVTWVMSAIMILVSATAPWELMNIQNHSIKGFLVWSSLLVFLLSSMPHLAYAGFGITPPYVRNTSLTRNSTYEQTILLVRSDPTAALKASLTIDAPGFEDWFTVDEGLEFLLPQGEQKVPMTVRVTVPGDADFKQYTGNIRIKTGPPDDQVTAGAVSISLGAQVDIDLNVIDKVIEDFRIRKIGINDLNEGHKVAWLYFPGKIRFKMLLENTGNVPIEPSEVNFRIFDSTGGALLEETTHSGRMTKVDPFETEEIVASLPTRLPAGSYLAKYEIKNGDDIKQEGELTLSILPFGTLQSAGYGFSGLSLPHKVSVLLPVVTIFGITSLLLIRGRRGRRKKVS